MSKTDYANTLSDEALDSLSQYLVYSDGYYMFYNWILIKRNNVMHNLIKKTLLSIIILLSSIILGLLLLLLVYALPTNKMLSNTLRSYEIYQYEGTTPQLVRGYSYSQLDNYTYALMLLMAIKDKDIPLL